MASQAANRCMQANCMKSVYAICPVSVCSKRLCQLHLAQDRHDHQFPPSNNVTGQTYSDPHFIGFNNQNFSRQPPGDAIFFKNSSINFEIDARHEYTYKRSTNGPTVVKAICIQVQTDKIEYGTNDILVVNGKVYTGVPKDGLPLERTDTNIIPENERIFHVYTTFGPKVTVYNSYGYNLNVTLTLPRAQAENAEPSLLGNLQGGHGQMIVPTGRIFSEEFNDIQSPPSRSSRELLTDDRNDEQLKSYMDGFLLRSGITHKPTRDNLVFDYLNIPVGIRDQVINENIPQVKQQIIERAELIKEQQKAGYNVGSFDAVEEEDGYLERLEKRVSELERRMRMTRTAASDARKGRLESLEERITELEKQL